MRTAAGVPCAAAVVGVNPSRAIGASMIASFRGGTVPAVPPFLFAGSWQLDNVNL